MAQTFRDNFGADMGARDAFQKFLRELSADGPDVGALAADFEANVDTWKTLREGATKELQEELAQVFQRAFSGIQQAERPSLEDVETYRAMMAACRAATHPILATLGLDLSDAVHSWSEQCN
eukprot:1992244-Pyramimonas_sp.AAC.1